MQSILLQPRTSVQLKWLQDLAKMLKISFAVVDADDEELKPNRKTQRALDELNSGGGIVCEDFADYLRKIK